MRNFKSIFTKIIILSAIVLLLLYSLFLFVLPSVLSSDKFKTKFDNFVYRKTGIKIKSEQLKVKTNPNLTAEIKAEKIRIDSKEDDLIQAKDINISINIFKRSLKKIDIKQLYINDAGFKNFTINNNNKKKSNFKITEFPEINVEKAEIWADKNGVNSVFITVNNLKQTVLNERTYYTFEAEIISDLLKNLINIGSKGGIYIKDDILYADNLQILIGASKLKLNGIITDNTNNTTDLTLTGKEIPVHDVMASLLYLQKIKEPGKKFMENFYDYSGNIDIDLKINNDGFNGIATANNLSGKTVLFDVPINFPKADFIFKGYDVEAQAEGTLGGEKVFTSLNISGIATPDFEVTGLVESILHKYVIEKYVPNMSLKGEAQAKVNYKIKNKIIDVNYLLKLVKGSDIFYRNANLGLENKDRRLFVTTHKDKNKLLVTNYDYSITNGANIAKILLGEASFTKEKDKYIPDYVTCKTQGDAPISVTGSFYKYIEGGFFNGDLMYNFRKNLITGTFNIKDSRYKQFKIDNAKVNATEETINIDASGTYINSPFSCKLSALNKIGKEIKIYKMDLFLNEFIAKPKTNKNRDIKQINKIQLPQQIREFDVDVDKWTININKIIRKSLVINNLIITGNIHNKIFTFTVPKLNFAKGTINANGKYNYNDTTSDITIKAENIDSNTAADMLFDLKDQIEGTANAVVKAKTSEKLRSINANIDFSINSGYLPKLGSTEFMVKKSRMAKRPIKFKLEDIINVDIKNMKALSSDVKGNFSLNNDKIQDINITSSQKYLSLLIEGDYDITNQNADLKLFGKYNNDKISKVKILFVPLSLVVKILFRPEKTMDKYREKLKEVPQIEASSDEISAFRVKLNGNINTNDVKVELKSIK